MIYTITLNPGLDYICGLQGLVLGRTNRTVTEQFKPGGKGINVAIVLNRLGEKSTAIGFTGGIIGEKLKAVIRGYGTDCEFIDVPGQETRINVKLYTDEVTEVNGAGIAFTEKEKNQLIQRIRTMQPEDLLVLSGTLPKGADTGLYRDLMSVSPCPVVLDTYGEALLKALPERPFFIKPNEEEIAELAGFSQTTALNREEIELCVRDLQKKGARNILVSRGKENAFLLTEDGRFFEAETPRTPEGAVIYPIGAGDSLVAGFIYASRHFEDPEDWLKYALSSGTSSVLCPFLAEKEKTEELFKTVR